METSNVVVISLCIPGGEILLHLAPNEVLIVYLMPKTIRISYTHEIQLVRSHEKSHKLDHLYALYFIMLISKFLTEF